MSSKTPTPPNLEDNQPEDSQPQEKEPQEKEPQEKEPINQPEPAFGWTPYAEQINGRFAMIGIVLILLLEFLTGQDLLSWIGLR